MFNVQSKQGRIVHRTGLKIEKKNIYIIKQNNSQFKDFIFYKYIFVKCIFVTYKIFFLENQDIYWNKDDFLNFFWYKKIFFNVKIKF